MLKNRLLRHTFSTVIEKKGATALLKGVHHQIVEIRQTDHPFFERAILIVRADCAQEQEDDWQKTGREFVRNATPYSGLRRARAARRLQSLLYGIGGAVFGILLGVFLPK